MRGPQVIIGHGRKEVVIAVEEGERKTRRQGTLADFFAASPLRESGLEIERPMDGPRTRAASFFLDRNVPPGTIEP